MNPAQKEKDQEQERPQHVLNVVPTVSPLQIQQKTERQWLPAFVLEKTPAGFKVKELILGMPMAWKGGEEVAYNAPRTYQLMSWPSKRKQIDSFLSNLDSRTCRTRRSRACSRTTSSWWCL